MVATAERLQLQETESQPFQVALSTDLSIAMMLYERGMNIELDIDPQMRVIRNFKLCDNEARDLFSKIKLDAQTNDPFYRGVRRALEGNLKPMILPSDGVEPELIKKTENTQAQRQGRAFDGEVLTGMEVLDALETRLGGRVDKILEEREKVRKEPVNTLQVLKSTDVYIPYTPSHFSGELRVAV